MRLFVPVLVVFAMAASACTTHLYSEKRAEDYNKQASRIEVVWKNSTDLKLHITKTAQGVQPSIGPQEREETGKKVAGVIGVLQGSVSSHLATRLKAEGVTVKTKDDPEPAQAYLFFSPRAGIGDCSVLGCMGSVDLYVSFIDVELKKTVWAGFFKVGTNNVFSNPDESIAESFYGTLVGKLKSERLISVRK